VENAEINLSGYDTLYLWVGEWQTNGRYETSNDLGVDNRAGGSTEVSFDSRDGSDGESDLPFLVGAGGAAYDDTVNYGAARGGSTRYGSGNGTPPPQGGGSGDIDGFGAIDDQNRGLVSGGTTIEGGGASTNQENGEIKITYEYKLKPPEPPSNLSAGVQ
jgi:hypothetical protein